MDPFEEAVERRDAGALRALLAARPELRAGIDRPIFGAAAPAIVHCRGDRAMVDVLLEFGADINAHSQFWGRTVGVLADNIARDARLPDRAGRPAGDRCVRGSRRSRGRSEGSYAAREHAGAAPAHRPAAVPFRRAGDPRGQEQPPDGRGPAGVRCEHQRPQPLVGRQLRRARRHRPRSGRLADRARRHRRYSRRRRIGAARHRQGLAREGSRAGSCAGRRRPAAAALCQHHRDHRPAARSWRRHQRPRRRPQGDSGAVPGPRRRTVPSPDCPRRGRRHLHGGGAGRPGPGGAGVDGRSGIDHGARRAVRVRARSGRQPHLQLETREGADGAAGRREVWRRRRLRSAVQPQSGQAALPRRLHARR